MPRKAKAKYPKTLYVKLDGANGAEFFNALEKAEDYAESGKTLEVAVYQLERIAKVTSTTTIEVS